jgi:hypothetical protein
MGGLAIFAVDGRISRAECGTAAKAVPPPESAVPEALVPGAAKLVPAAPPVAMPFVMVPPATGPPIMDAE